MSGNLQMHQYIENMAKTMAKFQHLQAGAPAEAKSRVGLLQAATERATRQSLLQEARRSRAQVMQQDLGLLGEIVSLDPPAVFQSAHGELLQSLVELLQASQEVDHALSAGNKIGVRVGRERQRAALTHWRMSSDHWAEVSRAVTRRL